MKFYIYDPNFNYKYELEGINKISDIANNENLLNLLGVSYVTIYKNYKDFTVIKKINKYIIDESVKFNELKKIYSSIEYEDECWKPLDGHERYLISNYGRFKKIYKKYPNGKILSVYPENRMVLNKDLKLITLKCNNSPSQTMMIKIDDREYAVRVLVAKHFLDDGKTGQVVRHLNEKFYDCRALNLEYIDKQEIGKETGFYSRSKEVARICPITNEIIETYRSVRMAGRENFMSYQTVLDNIHGKTKLAFGEYKFIYV